MNPIRNTSPRLTSIRSYGRSLLWLATLTALLSGGGIVHAAGKTEALLLSCMDYRLIDDTERYMSERGLRDQYDHVILAGASLGVLSDAYPAWRQTFWEHLDISLQLHHIHRVILLDHRDCGAYKVILGEDFAADRERETQIHMEHLEALANQINARYPQLEVETHLMDLDGTVETVHIDVPVIAQHDEVTATSDTPATVTTP